MSIKELKTPEGYRIVVDVRDAVVRVGEEWVPVGERLRELEVEVLRFRALADCAREYLDHGDVLSRRELANALASIDKKG